MDTVHLIMLLIAIAFIILQLSSFVATSLIVYNSKRNGGSYCTDKSFFLLTSFYVFLFLFLIVSAGYYIMNVPDISSNRQLVTNNLMVFLWTLALIGTLFFTSIITKSKKKNCFEMSSVDKFIASVSLVLTAIAFGFVDYFIVKKIVSYGNFF